MLLAQIAQLIDRGSQVILSTHSPLLASATGAEIFELDDTGIHRKNYDDLALVQNWRRFLGEPESFLRHLF